MNLESIDFHAIAARERTALEFRQECEQLSRLEFTPLLARAEANTKIRKSMRVDYRLTSLSLAHHKTSGHNVCSQASAACSAACVGSENIGLAQVFGAVMDSRIRRTRFLMEDRPRFLRVLIGELHSQQRIAERNIAVLACRLNQFSDISWEDKNGNFGCIPQMFPECIFWDYTKVHSRLYRVPDNYHLCGSWSELKRHQAACESLLNDGYNVAMVFSDNTGSPGKGAKNQQLPKRHKIGGHWFEVYSGDDSDLRFLDPGETRGGYGRICGLTLKSGNTVSRESAIRAGFSVHREEA